MEFALNYSPQAADLLRAGKITIDRFKCPDWPDLVAEVQATYPIYVHFSLRAGPGKGDAVDTHGQAADWGKVERLLMQTDTPLVNLHLAPLAEECPQIDPAAVDHASGEQVAEQMIRDVRGVVARFGAERVIVENDPGRVREIPRAALLPDTIRRVVEETGCGLLLDVSHARMAARDLGLDARAYLSGLPVAYTREVHITGIQRLVGRWLEMMRRADLGAETIQRYAGQMMDHLPLTAEDWEFVRWAAAELHRGAWGKPWVATFEYGGVNSLIGAVTDADALADQTPVLYALLKGTTASTPHATHTGWVQAERPAPSTTSMRK
jgi:uncharacterized protein (UPF0276 family)